MKEKILFVINSLHGGGAERVVSHLSTHFYKKKYQVVIICLNSAEPSYEVPKDLNVYYLFEDRKAGLLYRGLYFLKTPFRLNKILVKEKPNCVVAFMTTANFWAGLIATLKKIPFIVSERTTPDYEINKKSAVYQKILYQIYKRAKAVVVPSKGLKTALKKNQYLKKLENICVIINPVKSLGAINTYPLNDKKYILGVGRLSYEKGFDILIDAFALLKNNQIDLLIIGEGPDRNLLQEKINTLSLQENVKLLGCKTDVQNYYYQSELFVLSSRSEGYPNALIEAMSIGCPCIAMDCEFGPSEIITHEENGLLLTDKSAENLSKNIFRVLSDKFLKEKLSNNARLINITNSFDIIASEWERLLKSII